jgi:Mob1/phocein family
MDDRGAGVKHLVNIFRRLHRIFAHAWFQHREVFWRVEGQTGLYVLFKTVCDNYELLPAENYKLPPEAEGLEPISDTKPAHTILRPDLLSANNAENKPEEDDPSIIASNRTNTRRHIRSSPSTGSAVQTVLEADEDDSEVTQKLVEMHIADDEAESGKKEDDVTNEGTKVEIHVEPELKPETNDEAEAKPKVEAEAEVEVEIKVETTVPNEVEMKDNPPALGEPEKDAQQVAPREEQRREEEIVAAVPVATEPSETAQEKNDAEHEHTQAVD